MPQPNMGRPVHEGNIQAVEAFLSIVTFARGGPTVLSPLLRGYGPMPWSNIGRTSDSPSNPGQCF
jgi:hypothetical protein